MVKIGERLKGSGVFVVDVELTAEIDLLKSQERSGVFMLTNQRTKTTTPDPF
jgi:hypothetical protein